MKQMITTSGADDDKVTTRALLYIAANRCFLGIINGLNQVNMVVELNTGLYEKHISTLTIP